MPPTHSPRPCPVLSAPGVQKEIGPTLLARARWLAQVDRMLRQVLPAELAGHCVLANIRGNALVFLADSPLWATRLRLYHTALVDGARRRVSAELDRLSVKVARFDPVPPEPFATKPLSNVAATHLKEAASSQADPELRELLLRLASLA